MPPAEFWPANTTMECPQTYALDGTAAGIGRHLQYVYISYGRTLMWV
jgi:hypothetical protein